MREFEIHPPECGHQWHIRANDLTLEECQRIHEVVCCQWTPSPDYRLAHASGAFLQGYQEPRNGRNDGWAMVEFWTEKLEDVQAFVNHLSKRLEDEE